MAAPREHRDMFGQDLLAPHLRRERQQRIDRDIQRARGKLALQIVALAAHGRNLDQRRHRADPVDQRAQHWRLEIVAQADHEPLRRLRRIEAVGVGQRRLQAVERLAHRGDDLACQRRRRHHVVAAHEQRIVEHRAQPAQRMAHRGLCQIEAEAGPADAALGIDRVEHDEQVQVDVAYMHGNDLPVSVECI
ncbi:hypothetical protein HAP48_0032105 [Bradyrhizobium septentrionale]|nr:hypothetical protein [Bradyrhizobium septentrionale]UGY13216.1 hypothetical protein HAP48_0032105 [Bradyrhizobium septentrionale]